MSKRAERSRRSREDKVKKSTQLSPEEQAAYKKQLMEEMKLKEARSPRGGPSAGNGRLFSQVVLSVRVIITRPFISRRLGGRLICAEGSSSSTCCS